MDQKNRIFDLVLNLNKLDENKTDPFKAELDRAATKEMVDYSSDDSRGSRNRKRISVNLYKQNAA